MEKVTYPDGRIVARKKLKLNSLDDNTELIRRFEREVTYQSKLNHKNIVPIIDINLNENSPFFDMPLATCDLGKELEGARAFSAKSKIYAFLCALSGIEHLHLRKQLHRDIKPENILRFDYANGFYIYKVSDLGLISPPSGKQTTNITRTGHGFGTEEFLAREIYRSGFQAATIQSDIYSLGVLLFYLFAEKKEIENSDPYSVRNTDHPMGEVITKCTASTPSDRYENVAKLRSEFIYVSARMQGVIN